MITSSPAVEIQMWPIDKFVFYVRNPRKNDAAVDRMRAAAREFRLKIRDNWLGILPHKKTLKETYAN